ncbi:biogenesis of lysosome-related organelles complex 1 subunit 4 isoform X2 [Atheta coriaria]
MIESACNDYSEFLNLDLNTKFQPINQSVDDILTRLEEFETMVLLIQQERCNAIGLTGSLTDCVDIQPQVQQLCHRIDSLEALTEYLKTYVNSLENKIDVMEEKLGFGDNANVFKSFLKSSLFKKTEVKPASTTISAPLSDISVQQFFTSQEGGSQ